MENSYSHLNPESLRWHERCLQTIVAGGQAHRRTHKYTLRGGPAYVQRALGARFWDVDGREFIDYLMSYGPILIGHADPRVNAAVQAQLSEGTIFSLEHPKVIELAERLCQIIPCAERLTFLVGGSSATLAAVRCARAHTRRERVVRCGYHGWFDWCFPEDPGAPAMYRDLVTAVPYNDLEALSAIFARQGNETACFILEGYLGDGPSPGYMAGVRELCDRYGVIFIFDEVKTGFRFSLGGAQEVLGVEPDLATFGKAMCNGFPGSALVGRAEILEGRADTFIGATFHGDLASVAAAGAVLDILEEGDGLPRIHELGRRLIAGIDAVFAARRFPLRMRGYPVMPEVVATKVDDRERPLPAEWAGKVLTEWCAAMMRRGIFLTGHVWYISLAHTQADIDATVAAAIEAVDEAQAVLERMSAGELLELPFV